MTRRTQSDLPLIDSCEGCGACCMEQCSPPGYVYILLDPSIADDPGLWAEDLDRVKQLPSHLVDELLAYGERIKAAPPQGEQPCLWYDRKRQRCKHYEHRPSICRDNLEPGDDDCRAWRQQYQVKPIKGVPRCPTGK